jgi:hypothetical protein
VLEQDLDHRLARGVAGGIQAELLEVLVLAHQVGGRVGQEVEEAPQLGAARRLLQVVDDVELDAALAQQVQRAARLASAGVVVDDDPGHARRIASGVRRV